MTSIYCYIEERTEYWILGFMNAANHKFDEDCFNTIKTDNWDNGIDKIHSIMTENNLSNTIIDQDNENWRYMITDINELKYIKHVFQLIDEL